MISLIIADQRRLLEHKHSHLTGSEFGTSQSAAGKLCTTYYEFDVFQGWRVKGLKESVRDAAFRKIGNFGHSNVLKTRFKREKHERYSLRCSFEPSSKPLVNL